MTSRSIEASDMMKDFVEKNLNDKNKIPIHHHINIEVLEFVDAENLNNMQITFNEAKKTRTNYIRENSILSSTNFLEDTLVQLFNANKMPVMDVEVSSTNFNPLERKIREAFDRVLENIESEQGEEENAD